MSELVVIEQLVPADVFKTGGGDPIVDRIRKEVLAVDRDISTEDGRKNVKALAYKVARSKTLLDEMGKAFASDLKEKVKAIDSERSHIWDALESLQKEVRQPLTEFEEKEKARIARHEADLLEIENAGIFTSQNWINLSVEAMQDRLTEIRKEGEADRQEFAPRFQKSIEDAGAHISSAILKRKNHDAEQAELERIHGGCGMTFDPLDLANKLVQHGNDWSDKNAAADVLEETRKTLRAQIALKFLAETGAMNKAETMAEATIEYIDHIRAMVEARRLANRAKVHYDTDRAYIDMLRSQESTRREEMRIR